MSGNTDPLSLFHPLVADWFRERVGVPTDPQARAWPEIAAGKHVLVTAPTGSGKTLTAFLWAIDRLLTGKWQPGKLRVLYISPLKALNVDVERNLSQPLAELAARFEAGGLERPEVRTAVRSGDTPAAERQRLVRHPPEILITTPESLNLLLTSKAGRTLFDGLETVILDEIHAVAGTKRGVHLMTAVERLTLLAGDFQRVALSATVKPLERVAELVGGLEMVPEGEAVRYRPRPVEIVRSDAEKRYEVKVRFPAGATIEQEGGSFWDALVPQLVSRVGANRSTLLFTNSRRMTEKVTRFLNEAAGCDLAYSHHGSLSKEVRTVVESRLKRGELPALVATSSLELGIDVGDLDEVLLIQAPKAVSSGVQRIGRAGHRVGEVSRGSIYPTFGRDFLQAAVMAKAVLDQDIEEVRPVANALDVLAQVILSMTVAEEWQVEELYAFLRSTHCYRSLSRRAFDLTIEMLAGRYADARVRELKPRLAFDRVDGTLSARPGVDRLLYLSGGTIPDRGYFTLRVEDSMARLGELDEEFVWERSVGDTFTLGAQGWRIRQITHNDVLVAPSRSAAAMAPFWRADERDRDAHLSERVARFLELADVRLEEPAFRLLLAEEYAMEPPAAAELLRLLALQKAATGALPHRHRLLVEWVGESAPDGRKQAIFHTFWGGKVNRPFALALAAAWESRYPTAPIDVMHDDDCVLAVAAGDTSAGELLSLVSPSDVELLLRRRLEATGFFGARFRENAGRALLLPKAGFRHRTPLWLNRQRAKKLLEAVSRYGDFPLVMETWRTCLEDEFELTALKARLSELAAGEIAVVEASTAVASPFAAGLVWKQTNTAMYEDDTPLASRGSGLRPDLLRELVLSSGLKPRLSGGLIEEFERKVQRLHPGYAPRSSEEVLEWVKERVLMAAEEWSALLAAVERDAAAQAGATDEVLRGEEIEGALSARLVRVLLPGAEVEAICAIETLPRLARALQLEAEDLGARPIRAGQSELPAQAQEAIARLAERREQPAGATETPDTLESLERLLAEWARFFGPFPNERPARFLGGSPGTAIGRRLEQALENLVVAQSWVVDTLRKGSAAMEICDAENLETLLRWARAAARPSFEALPLAELPLFLAAHQGLTSPGDSLDDLKLRLEQLLGFPAPAAAWEEELLPARLAPYYTSWLDTLLAETDLLWLGVGPQRLTFAFPGDLELVTSEAASPPASEGSEPPVDEDEGPPADTAAPAAGDGDLASLFPAGDGRFDLVELVRRSGLPSAEVSARLWRLAWQGRVTNDSFAAVRKGLLNRFQPVEEPQSAGSARSGPMRPGAMRSGRGRFDRWQASRPFAGAWLPLPSPEGPADAMESAEQAKERVRLLLERYGILFRELLARELPAFQWSAAFRALRLMELSGEVLAGYFFQGIPGPQFVTPGAFRLLQRGLPEDASFWLNALDPASPCGLDLEGLKAGLPRRHPTTHLVYQGSRPVVVSKRHGKELAIEVPPDHPRLPEYLGLFKVLLTRDFRPRKSIEIQTLNGEPAGKSPYVAVLADLFGLTRDPSGVRLWKRY